MCATSIRKPSTPRSGRHLRRALLPLGGLLLAMGMHALWNGSSSFGEFGFFAVYAAFMVPSFGLLTWLAVWTRQRELRTVRDELPVYAAAGWLAPAEPFALGSMRARRLAREYAGLHLGRPAAREVARYEADATSLAFLRHRGRQGRAGADFPVRERELLDELWRRKDVARPALAHAARTTAPPVPVTAPPWPPYGPYVYAPGPQPCARTPSYGPGPAYGHGPGAPYGSGSGAAYGPGQMYGPGPQAYGQGPQAYGPWAAYGQNPAYDPRPAYGPGQTYGPGAAYGQG